MEVIQQTSDVSGAATLVQDALGQVALQSRTPGDTSNAATWSLQDRLGSTVAQTTTNGRITDLASYSDFGIPTFTSTGYASPTGYTGELTDATSGQNSYFSRTYDPFTATWLSADTYRGTLTNPQSQRRYGYVEGNPTTFVDAYGFAAKNKGMGAAPATVHTGGRDRVTTGHRSVPTPTTSGGRNVADRHSDMWDLFNPVTILGSALRDTVDMVVGLPLGFLIGEGESIVNGLQHSLPRYLLQALLQGPGAATNQLRDDIVGDISAIGWLITHPAEAASAAIGQVAQSWNNSPGLTLGHTVFDLASLAVGGIGATKLPSTILKAIRDARAAQAVPPSNFSEGARAPEAVSGPNGELIPIPQYGPPRLADSGAGVVYPIPKDGVPGLDPRVTSVRTMDPTSRYGGGYVAYENIKGQSVNPITGRTTTGKSDPYWHIPIPE